MRVTAVEMYSSTLEEAITFSLQKDDPNSQYQVRTILGLDADEIIPKFYGRANNGQDRYYDFSMKPREIVMRVVLTPRFNLDESYSDVRDELYKTISANRTGLVTLFFKAGATLVSRIMGSIVKFEAVHFTNLPEVQVTIRCNDPMFRAINPVVFETDDLPEISSAVRVPDSLSTAPHGFSMQATFTNDVAFFAINDIGENPQWYFNIIPEGFGFLTGDILYFSSEHSNKYLYIIRDADRIDLVDKIESGSMWPIIFPGQNEFYFEEFSYVTLDLIQYYPSYWGV